MTDGVMAVWGDVAPAAEAEFNEWYFRQHVPERVGVAGWRVGRRFKKIGRGKHRYLAVYDVDGPDSFAHPLYRQSLDNPTEWTQRMMPAFRNFIRAACRVRLAVGEVAGGMIATVRYSPPEAAREPIARWLGGDALHGLREHPGITRLQLWEADRGQSLVATKEQAIRTGADGEAPFTAVIEGTDRAAVAAALAASGIEGGLVERGAGDIQTGLYQLLFSLTGPHQAG